MYHVAVFIFARLPTQLRNLPKPNGQKYEERKKRKLSTDNLSLSWKSSNDVDDDDNDYKCIIIDWKRFLGGGVIRS